MLLVTVSDELLVALQAVLVTYKSAIGEVTVGTLHSRGRLA